MSFISGKISCVTLTFYNLCLFCSWFNHLILLSFSFHFLFVILIGILGNFLDLSFYFVELLLSLHNFNLQDHFLIFQVFLFHTILFLFRGCDNVFF